MILAMLSLTPISCLPYHSSDFGIYTQFTDGTTFSILVAKETDSALISPIPMPTSGLRGVVEEHNKAWVVCWNLDSLSITQNNHPSKVIYLGDTFSDSQPKSFEPREIRLNGSMNFVIRDISRVNTDSERVALYATKSNRMELVASIGAVVPMNAAPNTPRRSTPPVFSRSDESVFLWEPAPAIYSVSNLAPLRTISQGQEFKQLQATMYPTLLTDDRKYT